MPKRKLPPNEKVINMYRSGMSTGEIAEACSVTPATVWGLLRRIGEALRSPKESSTLREQRGRSKPARYWLGKKQSPEMVESRVSKIRGNRHYLWKGGQERRAYRDIKAKVICENCRGKLNLGFHHKDFDHYNDSPDNLAILCVSCHMSLHKKAYWDAVHAGEAPPRANGPVGWQKGGDASGGDNIS